MTLDLGSSPSPEPDTAGVVVLSVGVESEAEVVSRRWRGTIIGVVRGGGGHCMILISL